MQEISLITVPTTEARLPTEHVSSPVGSIQQAPQLDAETRDEQIIADTEASIRPVARGAARGRGRNGQGNIWISSTRMVANKSLLGLP
jgi:hypothetical protein